MVLSISDSSGNLVRDMGYYSNYHFPSENELEALKPGEKVIIAIHPKQLLHEFNFRKGETYTIFAIYRNEFDVTKIIDGVEVPAWVGSGRSNEETFVILP